MNDACGCCETAVSPAPALVTNRPGLTAVVYRIGDFARFRQAMVEAIARSTVEADGQLLRPLQSWTARQSDDYGIALLEMWAYLGDILTFYQERIANEAYLNTAVLRENVRRMAALLGYEPANGVAASTYLAYTLQEGKSAAIKVGMRVQSVPGQDEKPQKFESMEAITARALLNQFRIYAQPAAANPLIQGSRQGTLAPANVEAVKADLSAGDKIVLFPRGTAVFNPAALTNEALAGGRAFAAPEKAAGYLAQYGLTASAPANVDVIAAGSKQLQIIRFYDTAVDSWTTATGRRREIGEQLLSRVLRRVVGNPLISPAGVEEKEVTALEAIDWRTTLSWKPVIQYSGWSLGNAQAYKWVRKMRLFGYDAPKSYMKPTATNDDTVMTWRQINEGDKGYQFNLPSSNTLVLDTLYDDLKAGTQILLVNPDFTQLTRITAAVQVKTEKGPLEDTVTQITLADSFQAIGSLRSVVIYELAGPEITFWPKGYAPVLQGSQVYVPLVEWGYNTASPEFSVSEVEALLEPERRIILGDGTGKVQVTRVEEAQVVGDHLRITLTEALTAALDGATAVAQANVVAVTHGETVANEVLGSGDAARPLQTFSLKKAPVTFVTQAGAKNGAANTLEIRVDGVRWQEVDTLYGQAGDARVYTTRVDEENQMQVQFGDGQTGVRLPTGQNNIVATYRQGIGQEGNVATATLTTLLDKPVGVKEGSNPLPAAGGAEPEMLAEMRENAPNTVRTFGRVVSLRDFEDAARAFAGIAKARAAWRWDGLEQAVCLTVAGDKGAVIPVNSDTYTALVADLNGRRHPHRKLNVQSYRPVYVQVQAAIAIDDDYLEETVQANALAALQAHFAFDHRDLGQPIHLSDLYSVLQDVAGVIAVDIDRLGFKYAADRVSHGETAVQPQPRLAIFPAELAAVESPTSDLLISVGLSI